jgi:hypothetical protein
MMLPASQADLGKRRVVKLELGDEGDLRDDLSAGGWTVAFEQIRR